MLLFKEAFEIKMKTWLEIDVKWKHAHFEKSTTTSYEQPNITSSKECPVLSSKLVNVYISMNSFLLQNTPGKLTIEVSTLSVEF